MLEEVDDYTEKLEREKIKLKELSGQLNTVSALSGIVECVRLLMPDQVNENLKSQRVKNARAPSVKNLSKAVLLLEEKIHLAEGKAGTIITGNKVQMLCS